MALLNAHDLQRSPSAAHFTDLSTLAIAQHQTGKGLEHDGARHAIDLHMKSLAAPSQRPCRYCAGE